jgi:hypothetical protein
MGTAPGSDNRAAVDFAMATLDTLLRLAADCYAHARLSANPLTKTELRIMGDDYLKQAEELRRKRSVIQAAFSRQGRP